MAIFDLKKYVPEFLLTDTNVELYIEILEEVICQAYTDFLRLREQSNLFERDEVYLWNYILERGWTLDLDLTEIQKRKLLQFLPIINKTRGTTQVIINVVRLLYNIELEFKELTAEEEGLWLLDFSELGFSTYLSDVHTFISKTLLSYDGVLTDALKRDIKRIVTYLRAITHEYVFSWELSDLIDIDDRFQLGFSELEETSRLN